VKFREYAICRDAVGLPTKLLWLGDREIHEPTQAEQDAQKLKEWEAIYGRRG
jgi:hypothetical protein